MKKNLLTLLIIVGMFFITCGNEPSEEFYEGTPEDSAAIAALLENNSELLETSDMFVPDYIPIDLDSVTWVVADSYFRDDSTIIKQHVDSCGLELSERTDVLDFWFTKDTTCTVYLFDTFDVFSLMHCDVKYIGHYDRWIIDTIIDTTVTPWDTTYDTVALGLGTIDVDSTAYYTSLDMTGNGYKHIFFEPRRDSTQPIVDPLTNDITYPIIEPFDWMLRRVSYGIYWFPAYATELPDIDTLILTRRDGEADTILASNDDTTYTGHAMNRFRSIDSLLNYEDGETLGVTIILNFFAASDTITSFFASCGGSDRVELPGGSGDLVINGSGVTNLYFEAVHREAYYYVKPEKDYMANVWLLMVEIE